MQEFFHSILATSKSTQLWHRQATKHRSPHVPAALWALLEPPVRSLESHEVSTWGSPKTWLSIPNKMGFVRHGIKSSWMSWVLQRSWNVMDRSDWNDLVGWGLTFGYPVWIGSFIFFMIFFMGSRWAIEKQRRLLDIIWENDTKGTYFVVKCTSIQMRQMFLYCIHLHTIFALKNPCLWV